MSTLPTLAAAGLVLAINPNLPQIEETVQRLRRLLSDRRKDTL